MTKTRNHDQSNKTSSELRFLVIMLIVWPLSQQSWPLTTSVDKQPCNNFCIFLKFLNKLTLNKGVCSSNVEALYFYITIFKTILVVVVLFFFFAFVEVKYYFLKHDLNTLTWTKKQHCTFLHKSKCLFIEIKLITLLLRDVYERR